MPFAIVQNRIQKTMGRSLFLISIMESNRRLLILVFQGPPDKNSLFFKGVGDMKWATSTRGHGVCRATFR